MLQGLRTGWYEMQGNYSYSYSYSYSYTSYRYLTEAEPWKMKGENESRRPAIVRTTLEALYAFTHLLAPVLPMAAQTGTYVHDITAIDVDDHHRCFVISISSSAVVFKQVCMGCVLHLSYLFKYLLIILILC